ncbi:MAG: hypothetical protein JWO13_389 [Acidobacteriales bacterium]|nr:hypothetical protein [Terriglobales bacterium]
MKANFRFASLVSLGVAAMVALSPAKTSSSPQTSPSSCSSPEFHQLDFWIGEWDVFEMGATAQSANVRVSAVAEGCGLREEYEEETGLKGESLSSYDPSSRTWQQTWVNSRGQLLVIKGGLQAGKMVLRGTYRPSGIETRVRGIWEPIAGGVRESGFISTDGGKHWKQWFDLEFRPHAH